MVKRRHFLVAWMPMLLSAGGAPAQGVGMSDPRLHLRPLLTIGGDLAEEPYTFTRIGSIEAGPGGDIHVLDTGEQTVKVFGSDGRYLRTFGRPGGGPGEFAFAVSLQIDSLVRVFDAQAWRVSEFSLDGRLRESRPLPAAGDVPLAKIYPLRGGGLLGVAGAAFSLGAPSHRPNERVLLIRRGSAPETLIEYHSGGTLWHPIDRGIPWGIADSDFGSGGAVATLGDSLIAVADGYSGEVRWYRPDDGGLILIRHAKLTGSAPAVGEADLVAVERRLRQGQGAASGVGDIKLVAPPRWSIASHAHFASDGSLWVGSSVGAERGRVWTVFPAAGGPPRATRLPRGFELRSVHGNRMYGVERTELDVQVVRVYECRWE